MDTRYFQRLFRYDNWSNGEVLMALRVVKEPSAQVLRWLGHLAGAGHTWLARVNGKACPLAIWPELTMEECDHFLMLLGDEWQRYLDALAPAELSSMVEYRTSRGEEFSTTIEDILTQVLTHGSYHRGQIASAMRACGDTPASTDFILAARKGVLEG